VYAFREQIAQGAIDCPLARNAALASKTAADDLHGKMRFAARIVAGMPAMLFAIVDHGKVRRSEGFGQAAGDFLGDGACRTHAHSPYIVRVNQEEQRERRRHSPRLHGRVDREEPCAHPGCAEPGEFRAPVPEGRRNSFNGPGEWQWLCLDHVRAFNNGYNFFEGMSPDEIEEAQRPYAGWDRETRAFSAAPHMGPRWSDFADPLDAISARFRESVPQERGDGKPLSGENRKDLKLLGLETDATRKDLRQRYADLVRRYHPDRNGGDRSHEKRLGEVIAAYTRLKRAPAFA